MIRAPRSSADGRRIPVRPTRGTSLLRGATEKVVLPTLVLLVLLSCTAEQPSAAPATDGAAASSAFLPDDREAVTDAPRPTTTQVVLSFAVWDEATASVDAAGYVSPVIEDGGTCTLRLTGDGGSVSVTAPGMADATTTICSGLSVPGEQLAPGTWTVRMAYSSGTTDVVSRPLHVEVPA